MYETEAADARQAITENGAPVVFTRETEEGVQTFTGVALKGRYNEELVNGTSILAGDVRFMVSIDEPPQISDLLTFGGQDYRVINVQDLAPSGDTVIYYYVQGRK